MITEIRDFAPAGPITLSRAFVLFLFHDLSRVQKPCCRRPKAKSSSVEAWSIIPDAFAAPAFKYVNNLRIRIYLGSEQIQLSSYRTHVMADASGNSAIVSALDICTIVLN
jgi:hypothetical protein